MAELKTVCNPVFTKHRKCRYTNLWTQFLFLEPCHYWNTIKYEIDFHHSGQISMSTLHLCSRRPRSFHHGYQSKKALFNRCQRISQPAAIDICILSCLVSFLMKVCAYILGDIPLFTIQNIFCIHELGAKKYLTES